MDANLPQYEAYALRYATHERTRGDNFIAGADPHDASMPMDYFVWLVRDGARVWLVDTGFNRAAAQDRKRTFLRCPIESLSLLGVSPEAVTDVIVTHLHYDHAGNLDLLPNARIHIQERELHYAVGCNMCRPIFRAAYTADDVVHVVRGVYRDRVSFYRGDAELAPGLQLYLIGGHTDGLQVVRVHTRRGWVVLASDASHYYENMEAQAPYPIVYHVGDMVAGWEKVKGLAASPRHVVPGHDPEVLRRYPLHTVQPADGKAEIACLHEAPSR
ncbi:MAG: N-acyl homoserine lactonase family protein [Ramlibacter sp.]|jgi:glyoxylase-like metal-dependent hydrolase (beta-lactamase superfamily II)|nr:N-acyl homoserine lactonase family protein [Ramlibacter sp.]